MTVMQSRRRTNPFNRFALGTCCSVLLALLLVGPMRAQTAAAQSRPMTQWIRPSGPGQPLIWGRRDGIVFGLISEGGIKGPRGLIRIGVIEPGSSQPQLLNFIAVEPVAAGVGQRFDRIAFSELERSELDPGQRGKRMSVHPGGAGESSAVSGSLETLHTGKATVERLSVRIDVERFQVNGAHVYVIASMDSDHPGELRLQTYAEADSAPLEENTVTATMGNYERLRLLWLKDKTVESTVLFAGYDGNAFTEKWSYSLPEMLRTDEGGAIVFCTSDELSPAKSAANAGAHWVYPLMKYTQYWRVGGSDVQPDLRVRVNARRVYWNSTEPVPGGIAFENFEVRQRYSAGATFIFGITRLDPWELYYGSSVLKPWTANSIGAPGSEAQDSGEKEQHP